MLGEKIKELRQINKVKQEDLCNYFNVARGTISMWETNKREPDVATLKQLANYFHVSLDYLLENEAHESSTKHSAFDNATPAQKELVNRALESSDRVCNRVLAYMDVITDRELAADLLKFKDIDL